MQYITYRGRPTHSMYILVEIAHAAVALPLASCENRKMNRHNSHSENWFFKLKKS